MQIKKAKNKKKLLIATVFVVIFALANVAKIKAGTGDDTTGWIYGGSDDGLGNSSGLGWISMNNINPAAGGAVSYGVNIPLTDGNLSGYAWSENLGWIAFDNSNGYLNGCPDGNCVAKRVGNSLQGWARLTSIADAAAIGNSGGWLGWIHLNGPSYGVAIDNVTGKLSGYAWSDELGTISFRGNVGSPIEYGAQLPIPPVVSLSANPLTINLSTNGSLPQSTAISWTVSGATSCTKSGGNWSGTLANPTTGTDSGISQTVGTVDYKLTCTGLGGTTSADVTVTTGCYVKSCSGTSSCVLGSSLTITGSTTTAACSALNTCSTDSDCTPRSATGWKEVAP